MSVRQIIALFKKVDVLLYMYAGIGCLALLFIAGAWSMYSSSDKVEKQAQISANQETLRMAHGMANNVELSFFSADQLLRRVNERHYFHHLFGGNLKDDMEHHFKMWVSENPMVDGLMLVDGSGEIQLSYASTGAGLRLKNGENFSKNSHFIHQQRSFSNRLHMTSVVNSSFGERSYFILSRRQETMDGRFSGLIVAFLNTRYVMDLLESFSLRNDVHMAILDQSGQLLMSGKDSSVNQKLWRQAIRQSQPVSTNPILLMADKTNNEQGYLSTFIEFEHVPLMVGMLQYKDDMLALWLANHRNQNKLIALALGFEVLVAMMMFWVIRQMKIARSLQQDAQLASQAKSEFLARMSHELRTPLNAVIGFSQMMSDEYFGVVNQYQKERLQDIHMCGNHLLEFVNDILEYAKGEAGKIELEESDTEVHQLVGKAVRIVSGKSAEEGIKLVNSTEHDHTCVYVDQRKIRQILINLLSNALKFTPKGGIIRITSHMNENGDLVLSVTDTGIGMKPSDIPKALSLFEQVHRGDEIKDKQHYSGTGLGLPLCKMFAELHQGTLQLKSQPNMGTRVSVVIPKARIVTHPRPRSHNKAKKAERKIKTISTVSL